MRRLTLALVALLTVSAPARALEVPFSERSPGGDRAAASGPHDSTQRFIASGGPADPPTTAARRRRGEAFLHGEPERPTPCQGDVP